MEMSRLREVPQPPAKAKTSKNVLLIMPPSIAVKYSRLTDSKTLLPWIPKNQKNDCMKKIRSPLQMDLPILTKGDTSRFIISSLILLTSKMLVIIIEARTNIEIVSIIADRV